MMSLAEHIIEATPERIKREHFPTVESVPLDNSGLTNTMNWLASYLGDVEHLPSIIHLRLVNVKTLIYICTNMQQPGGNAGKCTSHSFVNSNVCNCANFKVKSSCCAFHFPPWR